MSGSRGEELNVDERDCIFCKIAKGELDAEVVHDENEVLAFKDINGRAPVHVLVIPRQHVESLEEVTRLPEPDAWRLFEVSSIVAGALGEIGERSRRGRE